MGYGIRPIKKKRVSKTSIVAAGLVIMIGLPLTIFSLQQRTETQQHAAQFTDLNTGNEIIQTNNADGSMGQLSSDSNYSRTFPQPYLGTINLLITDPEQPPQRWQYDPRKNTYTHDATHSSTQSVNPTRAPWYLLGRKPTSPASPTTYNQIQSTKASHSAVSADSQTVKSLEITIKKVEVHLAYVGLPGSKNEYVTPTVSQKQNTAMVRKTNQELDKWEVLNITDGLTIDLVKLAETHTLSSLGITKLVNGKYTEIRLYIDHANATLHDGTKVTLTIPGRSNIVRIVRPFFINSGKTTTLIVDFDARNSVVKAGENYLLKPVVAKFINQNEQ